MTKNLVIKQTETWLTSFIIKHNICPFARREHERGSIRYSVIESTSTEHCLEAFFSECLLLDEQTEIETTLIIYPNNFQQFENYLNFLSLTESLIVKQGYEGIYQLASFHPLYCFGGENTTDPANYTNRSPYPMLHLIREASLEQALKSYPKPEQIPEHNIELTRKMGLEKVQAILNNAITLNHKTSS